jgi:hypothetical protein
LVTGVQTCALPIYRNVGASRYASLGRRKWRGQYRPEMRDATPAGQAARDNLARIADVEQRKTNEMIGAELGYRYVDSPIIDNIPGGPEHLFREYHPTTWPGARLPHVWMADGSALQDHIPDDSFCLLRLGAGETRGIEDAFAALGAPLRVLDVTEPAARAVQGFDLLLRPDLHVVWRGNRPPEDAAALAAVATGH